MDFMPAAHASPSPLIKIIIKVIFSIVMYYSIILLFKGKSCYLQMSKIKELLEILSKIFFTFTMKQSSLHRRVN